MKTRYRAATIPIFPRTKMGMIFFLYTYSSYSSYLSHTINTNKPYSPVSLLPVFSYIPCHSIYLLSFLAGVSPPRSRIPFSPAPYVSATVVPFHIMLPLRGFCSYRFLVSSYVPWGVSFRFVPVFRLVGAARVVLFSAPLYRLVRRVVVSVPRLVRVVSWGGAPFLSAHFLVPSCLVGRCVSTGRSARRLVRRFVVRFGVSCVSSVVSSVVLCGVSSSHRIRCVIRHRSSGGDAAYRLVVGVRRRYRGRSSPPGAVVFQAPFPVAARAWLNPDCPLL